MSFQAKADGTIEQGDDPVHPTVDERKALLQDSLSTLGWTATVTQHDPQGRFVKFSAALTKGRRNLKIEIFLFPNLADTARGRDYEKRIQISRPYAEHTVEFTLDKALDHKCLLMGVYRREGKVVFCAWDAAAYQNHQSPTSCYVDIRSIATAMRDGFGQYLNTNNDVVCCFQPEFIHYYLENMAHLHDRRSLPGALAVPAQNLPATAVPVQNVVARNPIPTTFPRNRIVYGAPGTGKSYSLSQEVSRLFPHDSLRERITFYPEYSYSQFVGAYRPVPVYRESSSELFEADKTTIGDSKEPLIDYRFAPGPLLRLICRAINDPDHNYVLIIEELNRADAPAVFGESFQLLDRDESGKSRFSVSLPLDAMNYLKANSINASEIHLPSNLYLWATMNSADQGVLPLDTAFKRRWSFEYLPLNQYEDAARDLRITFLGRTIVWNDFRAVINNKLLNLDVPEDRLLGPFFMSQEELASTSAFKNKLLLYLRDDVVRHEPEKIFRQKSYKQILEDYDAGREIFVEGITFSDAV